MSVKNLKIEAVDPTGVIEHTAEFDFSHFPDQYTETGWRRFRYYITIGKYVYHMEDDGKLRQVAP